jgi:hypothetical protein
VAAAQVGKKLLEYTSVYPHFKEPTCWWVSIIKVDTSREVLYLGTCTHVAQGSVQMVKIVWISSRLARLQLQPPTSKRTPGGLLGTSSKRSRSRDNRFAMTRTVDSDPAIPSRYFLLKYLSARSLPTDKALPRVLQLAEQGGREVPEST